MEIDKYFYISQPTTSPSLIVVRLVASIAVVIADTSTYVHVYAFVPETGLQGYGVRC